MDTKRPLSHRHKGLVNSSGTVKLKPGCEKHTPKILNYLAKLKGPNSDGENRLSNAQNGVTSGIPSRTEVLPDKESARLSWADVVKLENRKA